MTQNEADPCLHFGAQTDLNTCVTRHLFLLCPNNSGSTFLSKALGTSPDVWHLPREGQHALGFSGPITQHENGLIWASTQTSLDQISNPKAFNWHQNKKAWYFQARAHSTDAKVFFTKAPPFLAYADLLKQHFSSTRFLIMVRNPYAMIEAILRRRGQFIKDLDVLLPIAVRHTIACLEMQRANQSKFTGISTFFTYEEMCRTPDLVEQKIKKLVPEIKTLQLNQRLSVKQQYNERLRDMNAQQIDRLAPQQISHISQMLEPHTSLLSHFGYELL
ncbi:sulfotransferase [Planktotalea sp.]|uniref:sulfotransferase n=1 Tax=Planktotalea sp. TaxID=2029877 RepID=UPI0032979493